MQGKHEQSWAALEMANGLQRSEAGNYDLRRHEETLTVLRHIFSPTMRDTAGEATHRALLAGAAGLRDPTPIFVVGMPRSGSSLVEQILSSHSAVYGAGTPHLLSFADSSSSC